MTSPDLPHPAPAPDPKAALRRELRALRRSLPARLRRQAARALARLARRHRLLGSGRRLGFYMPAKGEIDCKPMLEQARRLGAACHLPLVPPAGMRKLWFVAVGEGPYWRNNRFGIAEYGHHLPRLRANHLDTLFIPLLGFDRRGYRLGMGGGFYDASLAHLARARRWRRPRLVGLAFSIQMRERLPTDAWDVPLDAVLTERGMHCFRHNAHALGAPWRS